VARGVTRIWLRAIVWLNAHLKSAAIRLTRITGKSQVPIHPKHLVGLEQRQHWYLTYVEPGMRVLDAGCGNGVHSIRVASQNAKVTGVDRDLQQLQIGRDLSGGLGGTVVVFLQGDVECSLPFRSGRFDPVLLLDVLEHLHKRREALREIYRVLRRGGLMMVAAPNRSTSWKRRLQAVDLFCYTDSDHKIEYTWNELAEELRAGGFEPKSDLMPIVYDTPWAGLIDVTGGFSLGIYRRLLQWKIAMAYSHPKETIGWRVVCQRVEQVDA